MKKKSNTRLQEILDIAFKIIILVLCLAMTGLLFYAGFFMEGELAEKILPLLISGGGLFGAFYLYMRWRIIEMLIGKIKSDPDSIDGAYVKNALSLIKRNK